ncbi:MAG: hypothetical protein CVU09_08030 [Bacteroidetes bacterium HGW-Bacteroidetes-4]|nr:MAG: hypothetical protein CVU09_08030 [Bacteroidetes bacterium HGW-Bacteroidetes-4]
MFYICWHKNGNRYKKAMPLNKNITRLYYLLFIIGLGVMLFFASKIQGLLQSESITETISTSYALAQKQLSYAGIIVFICQLMISLYLFYISNNKKPILLSNILYIALMLYVYFGSNHRYYTLLNGAAADNTAYWLYLFMGLFYILGAILVSAIGYITVKNYTQLNSDVSIKNRRNKIIR